jgi:hypothetical protein
MPPASALILFEKLHDLRRASSAEYHDSGTLPRARGGKALSEQDFRAPDSPEAIFDEGRKPPSTVVVRFHSVASCF